VITLSPRTLVSTVLLVAAVNIHAQQLPPIVRGVPPDFSKTQGKSLEEVMAAKPTASFDAQVPQSAQTTERFIRWMYAEVKAAQR
jgi:hypothetical protein